MSTPFGSFWMGGFEGADHLNRQGVPLDMASACGHVRHLDGDYSRAVAHGVRVVRESIGWRLSEQSPGRFDFSRAEAMARTANRHGVQVVWTLMHYGTPPDVDLHDDRFIDRFAAFAAAAARAIGPHTDAAPVFNPINEIGFLAWAVSETSQIWPYRPDLREGRLEAGKTDGSTLASGYEVKRRLVRGVLAGIEAIRAVDPRARFLHVEPVVHVVAPADRPELADDAAMIAAYQWQAWDLISGRAEPELGGSAQALDRLGINHYHSGQWETGTEARLLWHLDDPRRRPLRELLGQAWERYGRPLILAETSHFGIGRARWLDDVGAEVAASLAGGVPVEGVCLYPVVDRPDWDRAGHWHNSGLWDIADSSSFERVLNAEYSGALRRWQRELG